MGIVINSNTGEIDVAASTPGTYRITYTTNNCVNSSTQDITINALPTVAISGTLSYCAGSTTTLTATAGLSSYLWSTGATTQSINITAGSYTVTGTDSNGCSNTSAQVTVTELALPTVAISGALSYCAGLNTTLTATAGLSSYLWSSGETTQSITATAGTYTVTGTDSNGCSNTSSSVTVTETPLDNAGFSYSSSSYEPTDPDPTPTITGLTGGTFSGTTGLVINSTTGEIDLSASTEATHTVTYSTSSSGSSVCPNTSTQTVEIAGIANNYSMSFDGSNDYLNAGQVDVTGTKTISLWFKTNDVTKTQVFYHGQSVGNDNLILGFYNSKILASVSNASGTLQNIMNVTALPLSGSFLNNTWYHIVLTKSFGDNGNNNGQITALYVNNYENKNWTGNRFASNSQANVIGKLDNSSYFDGQIDEVGIWNTELTSTQVAEIYNGTGTNTTKDLTKVSGSNLIYWNRMGD